MIDNLIQYGFEGLEVKGITIHNTNRKESASELYEELKNDNSSRGCHFLIDEKGVVEFMPLSWCTYHTGKGIDFGTKHTIAIEICRSQEKESLYREAQRNAIKKIKELMKEYNLTNDDIYFHNDFNNNAYCPHKILDIYGNKQNFIKEEL